MRKCKNDYAQNAKKEMINLKKKKKKSKKETKEKKIIEKLEHRETEKKLKSV